MKDVINNKEFNIGNKVANITKDIVCPTYPLDDFKNYNNQPKNNNIKESVVIDISNALFKTLLVEYNDNIICVRIYD